MVLQEQNPLRETPVRVGPFVNLVRHGYKNRAQEQISTDGIILLDFGVRAGEEVPRQLAENWQRHHKVVSVRFDEVVPGDGGRIDVMLTEWSKEIFAHDGQIDRAPGVGTPVHQPGTEVCRQDAEEGRHHDIANPFEPKVSQYQAEIQHHQRDADVNADEFLSPFSC